MSDDDPRALRVAAFERMAEAYQLLAAAERAASPHRDRYSTRKGHEPPEYDGRHRAWLRLCPELPGAVHTGRWWSISRSDYEAWRESQATTKRAPREQANAGTPWSPAVALASIGRRRAT